MSYYLPYLSHHQRPGAHWGIRLGPPYPLSRNSDGSLNTKKQAERKRNSTQTYGHIRMKSDKFASQRDRFSNFMDNMKETFSEESAYDIDSGLRWKKKKMTADQDLAAVNPMFPPRANSQFNCAYCSLAYDLRRRGYDVIAANKCGMSNDALGKLYKKQKTAWYLSDRAYQKELVPTRKRSEALNDWIRKTIGKQGEGASGMFSVAFDNDTFHSMRYENQNGKVVILDAQQNRKYDLDTITPCIVDAMISRTDNLTPDYNFIKKMGAVENARS